MCVCVLEHPSAQHMQAMSKFKNLCMHEFSSPAPTVRQLHSKKKKKLWWVISAAGSGPWISSRVLKDGSRVRAATSGVCSQFLTFRGSGSMNIVCLCVWHTLMFVCVCLCQSSFEWVTHSTVSTYCLFSTDWLYVFSGYFIETLKGYFDHFWVSWTVW